MHPIRFITTPENADEPWTGQAETVNGYTSFTWVERYREPGEFEIQGPLGSGLLDQLPLGTLVSHTDTYEFGMVENQVVTREEDQIVARISGRSLDAWLGFRVIGEFANLPTTPNLENGPPKHVLPAQNTWQQAAQLVRDHGLAQVTNLKVAHPSTAGEMNLQLPSPAPTERVLGATDVLSELLGLLEIEDLGINVYRPSGTRGVIGHEDGTLLWIHGGRDLSGRVIFSLESGDLNSLDYLVTNRFDYNTALVTGQYGVARVQGSQSGYRRRSIAINGSEADRDYADGGTWESNYSQLQELGSRMVARRTQLGFSTVRTSAFGSLVYKHDYNIGDIVMVDGNFGVRRRMRIAEHSTTVDNNGIVQLPSFSALRA